MPDGVPKPDTHSRAGFAPVASLAAAGCLWGTGFLFGKIAFREMNLSENVTYRFLFACLALAPIFWKSAARMRGRRTWLLLIAASIIGVPIQFLLQFRGLQLTTVSHASLIVGTLPVLLALGSALLLKERLKGYEYGLMLLSAAGAVLIGFGHRDSVGPQPTPLGDLLVFLSMFAALVMILISKRLIAQYGSLVVTAMTIVTGTIILVAWTETTHPLRFRFSPAVWLAVAAQGFLATAGAYTFWNWGLARVPAARAGVFLNLEPLVGTVLGVVVLHEGLGRAGILGGALILASAAYFSRRAQ